MKIGTIITLFYYSSTSTEATRKGLAMSKPVSGYLSLSAQPFLVDVLHLILIVTNFVIQHVTVVKKL